ASVLHRPDLVAAALQGDGGETASPDLLPPPLLAVAWSEPGTLSIEASSEAGLQELRVHVDGSSALTVPLSGTSHSGTIPLAPGGGESGLSAPSQAAWV